jgi:hypothetical protein
MQKACNISEATVKAKRVDVRVVCEGCRKRGIPYERLHVLPENHEDAWDILEALPYPDCSREAKLQNMFEGFRKKKC